VDGVILTFRNTKKTKPLALRARDMLKEVNADIVGVVINGISDKSGSGYYSYGGYRYGSNAYKYGYSYAYAYEEEEARGEKRETRSGV
jgi:Mrp family chromosome partitioning ATPase